ncbi:uncharacterized protein LOC132034893 [Lycium ferocissimum]|uniref:uncharacterized protein LOC132034893 n=1 Tax=Lycium ferocissimum TaxID=112874 RepID=UPI00281586AA|nr:uncharacterized protein LOC132034893 [Lycium ferocissimum]
MATALLVREDSTENEEVKKVPPSYYEILNHEGKTAHEVFTEEHQLQLQAAIMRTMGIPFSQKIGFSPYSPFQTEYHSSLTSTSLLAFVSLLTSRQAEEDFLHVWPDSLSMELQSMLASITFMTISFCSPLYLVLIGKNRWLLPPLALFALVPIFALLRSLFPFFSAVSSSTPGLGRVFSRKSKADIPKATLIASKCMKLRTILAVSIKHLAGVVSTVQPIIDQLGAESTKSKQDYTYYLPLYRASLCGDWEKAKSFLEKDKDGNRAPITSLLQTALHIAIGLKNDDAKYFIENLVKSMTDDDALAILQDSSGETPLHYAARFGNLDAAKILVQGNPNLPHVASNKGLYPIHLAAEYGYNSVDLVHYFFSVTKDSAPYTGRTGVRLLYRLICADLYDLAKALVDKFPDLASYYSDELYPLALLATKVFVFVGPSGLNSHKRASFRESRSTSIMPQARAKSNDIENNAVDEPNKLMPKFTQKLLSLYYASSNFVRKYGKFRYHNFSFQFFCFFLDFM